MTGAVEAIGLRKDFGPIHAVAGIDLALEPGHIYGLLGPNGSGKTTLIRLLAGLAKPSAGEARILGTRMPSRPMLGKVGYMPQAEALYPDLSVGENIGFFATLQGVRGSDQIDRALGLVELGDRKGTPVLELSGGMRRRLSLAMTLVHEPPVMFLDEPTVGVDPALRVQFWSHFRRLADAGTTIL
ncbi:MAG TPA: ABC transporter ATP-binding protein, partial [Candidatus Limnocylindrales bacterium]